MTKEATREWGQVNNRGRERERATRWREAGLSHLTPCLGISPHGVVYTRLRATLGVILYLPWDTPATNEPD